MFDKGYGFKQDFNPLLKESYIKLVLTPVKNPQDNPLVERVQRLILNIIVTKDVDNKVFGYIDPWGKTLEYIAWYIRASYHRTIMSTSGQAVFGRYMLFNLASVVDWKFATSAKQHQLDIGNFRENARQVTHDYAISDRVYTEMTGIYQNIDYKKKGLYGITEVFTNGTFRVQRGKVN